MAGEITNGGLVAIRSNVSSRTGSKREPVRTSMFGSVVEGRVELRRPHGPGVDVGGDDGVGVGRQVQRLDSAPGAEVERPGDRLAQRELGQ